MRFIPAANPSKTGTVCHQPRTAEIQIRKANLGSIVLQRHINMPYINSCLLKHVIKHIFKVHMSDHLSH